MTPRSSSSRPCPSTYSHIASRSLSSTWSILSEGQKGLAFIIMVDTLLHHYQRLWKVEATAEISITRQRPKRPKSRVRPASTAAFSSLNNLCHSPYLPKNIVPKKVVNCPNLEKSVFFKVSWFFFQRTRQRGHPHGNCGRQGHRKTNIIFHPHLMRKHAMC